MKNLPLKEIMTRELVTLNTEASVAEVAQIFREKKFHHLPIVDDRDTLRGIISRTDFDRIQISATLFRNPKIEAYNEALFHTMVARDIMTKDVVQLRPTDTIQNAYIIFKDNKFRALPVIEKGKLVGIITPLDILDYFFTGLTVDKMPR